MKATWPIRIGSPANLREPWQAKARRVKREREQAMLLCRTTLARPVFTGPALVTFTRIAPRSLDDDNLAYAFKGTRDAVAQWLGVDDGNRELVRWAYAQRKGAPKLYAVEVDMREDRRAVEEAAMCREWDEVWG